MTGKLVQIQSVYIFHLGPRFPFEPKELNYLQRKTDTLTGRELSKPIQMEQTTVNLDDANRRRQLRLRDSQSLDEYRWKVQDDDDNLNEDVLAPRYTSF